MFSRVFPVSATAWAVLVFAIFMCCAYLHPFHIHPYRTYYHDLLCVLGLSFAIIVFVGGKTVRLRLPAISYLFLALLTCIFTQFLFDRIDSPSDLLMSILYIVVLIAAIILGASWGQQTGGAALLCYGLAVAHLIAGLLSVIFQCIQLSGMNAWPLVMYIAKDAQPFMRPYANVAQPNQLALLLCLALAAIIYLYKSNKIDKVSGMVATVILLFGLTLTHSRIGWVIIPAFALLGGQKFDADSLMAKRISPLLSWGACLLYALMVLALPYLGDMMGFAGGSVVEHISGRSERMSLWTQAWHMAATHPWFGVGWFGFGAEQVHIAADFASGTYSEHAHNLILNFAAELGWPFSILFFGVLAWWFYQTCIKPQKTLPRQFASLCFIAVLVHSMVEFPLWYAYVLVPTGVLMGMVHQLRWPGADTHSAIKGSSRFLLGTATTVIVAAIAFMAVLTLDYQRVVAGFQALRTEQAGYAAPQAPMQKPALTFYPQFFEYFKLTRATPREGMSAEEIAYLEKWGARFGFVHVINKLAEVYVLNGQPKKASRAMLTLQRLHPISYPEYYDYWKVKAGLDERYRTVFAGMPPRDAP
ncbi:Wzy polymerase domain-containing protein [Undibacterium sp. TJN19]|uniref:PglL family O-oligosaccharyltransferase n=1 Tax=Undibacterium sp. TJN19 TaxID=3413055 RepID=UPI003BF05980